MKLVNQKNKKEIHMRNFTINDYDDEPRQDRSEYRGLGIDLGESIKFLKGKINGRTFLISTPADDEPERIMVCLGYTA